MTAHRAIGSPPAQRRGRTILVDRRTFLKMAGSVGGGVALSALGCNPQWAVPEEKLVRLAQGGPGAELFLNTLCGLCPSACGIQVRLIDGLPVGLRGNPEWPVNRGGMCMTGLASLEFLYSPNRLEGPVRAADGRGHDHWEPISWDLALERVASKLSQMRDSGAGNRFAFVTGPSGQLMDELRRWFTKFMGSSNYVRTGSEKQLGFYLTQGIRHTPGYDIRNADYILNFSLGFHEEGPAPVHYIEAYGHHRSEASHDQARYVHLGTRLSLTASNADEWVAVRPGTTTALALGIAYVLVRERLYDREFVSEHTFGFEDHTDDMGNTQPGFKSLLASGYYPDRVAQITGVSPHTILRIGREFGNARRPIAMAGGEAMAGRLGTFAQMAVHSLNALVGSFERKGGITTPEPIPFIPMPPDPIPAPMSPSSPTSSVFRSDEMEAFCDSVGDTDLDVVFIHAANPVFTSPAGNRLAQLLERAGLVVSFSGFLDETAAFADIVLPDHFFLEKWEERTTVPTVAFPTVGVHRPVIDPIHDTRHSGDVLLDLLRRTPSGGTPVLPWPHYLGYMKDRIEGIYRSGAGALVSGTFHEAWVSYLKARGWRFLEYETFEEFWELLVDRGWWNPVYEYRNWDRVFKTPTGRFEFSSSLLRREVETTASVRFSNTPDASGVLLASLGISANPRERYLPHHAPHAVGVGDDSAYPLVLALFEPLTNRGGCGAISPMLQELFGMTHTLGWLTWAEIHPQTASAFGIRNGEEMVVESALGAVRARAVVQPLAVPNVVALPIGQGHRSLGDFAGGIGANPIHLVADERDALDGRASLHTTRVRVRPVG